MEPRLFSGYASVFLLLMLMAADAVNAEELEDVDFVTVLDVMADLPMVSSVTRLSQRSQDAPGSVTIIDQEMIRAAGIIHLPDVFRLVPGFQVVHANGNSFGVMNHGAADRYPRRLEVMVNGRSVYQPLLSTVEWTSLGIDLDDIDYIEVMRGSNVPAQGSNALFGAINIITKSPLLEHGQHLRLTAGSVKTRNLTLQHAGEVGPLHVRGTLAWEENDGFKGLPDDKEVGLLNIDALYTPTSSDTLNVRIGYAHNQTGIGDSESDRDDVFSPVSPIEFTSSFQELQWKHLLNTENELELRAYHNRLVLDDRRSLGSLSELLSPAFLTFSGQPDQQIYVGDPENVSTRYGLELQHTLQPFEPLRVVWGAGVRHDIIESDFLFQAVGHTQEDETYYRAFAHAEWGASKRLVFNFGLMFEYDAITDTHVSARGAINFHLSRLHTLRFAATTASRSPSLYEARINEAIRLQDGSIALRQDYSDPFIDNEEMHSYEIAYIGSMPSLRLNLDARVFHEEIDEAIDFDKPVLPSLVNSFLAGVPGEGPSKSRFFTNMTEWTTQGLELQASWRPLSGTFVNAAYAYTNLFGYRRGPLTGERRTLEDSAPHHTASVLVSQELADGILGSAAWYRISPLQWLGGQRSDGYSRIDLRLGIPVSAGRSKGEMAFVVQNLLDREYTEYSTNNLFERRLYFQVSLSLP